ncbi:hypothetical protein GGR50DRAFT_694295 [Xylaria sp. CBS 124048]|nr:hypothetical protein GGR50DRAFT_694295 [Xylaria sp. CBS 124048]
MSLSRAFNSRRGKQSPTDMGGPQRSNTITKNHPSSSSLRNKISSPVELTHTTNMLAYNAPDLYPRTPASQLSSPTHSSRSDDESYIDSASTAMSSPPTSPEMSMGEQMGETPEPNHLSCYFVAPTGQKTSPIAQEAPAIPRRAPSHTKKSSLDNLRNKHPRFSNQSSATASTKDSSMLSRTPSNSTTTTSVSTGHQSQKPAMSKLSIPVVPSVSPQPAPLSRRHNGSTEPHPFGQELAKVSELAEELGVKEKLQDTSDEAQQLIAKGLKLYTADDYLNEIQDLLSYYMTPEPAPLPHTVWI